MPSAKTSSPYQTLLKNEEDAKYLWTASKDGATFSRALTNFERMFEIFNHDLHGQNCPMIGASMILKTKASTSPVIMLAELAERANNAFKQTRRRYPTVAARIEDRVEAVYKVEEESGIDAWAKRTVRVVEAEGGWLALREELSRTTKIPSIDGDCCLFYIIVNPRDIKEEQISSFDVLMHTHHVFTDGAGIRSILNEFLERFASPLSEVELVWGDETERLLPPSLLLEKDDEKESTASDSQKSRLKGFVSPDIGLPVYRPDIHAPTLDTRGTLLVTHTFPETFLPKLLNVGRAHGVKLTSVLHASLLKAMYDAAESTPKADDVYKSGSAMDLRNGYMCPEFCERKIYVNSAVSVQPIEVPCELFTNGQFWKAAEYIKDAWAETLKKKGIAKATERDGEKFLSNWANLNNGPRAPPTKPRTCPYFVSDPPGIQLLSPSYKFEGLHDGLEMVLESYQLATDQNQAVVSARSHSWNDKLTLCLVFNAIRNPKDKMEEFMNRWIGVIESICEDRYV